MPKYSDRVNDVVCWIEKDYQSGTITLYNEDYKHLINHTVMIRNENAIKETIRDPDFVERDKNAEDRRVFYKYTPTATYYPNKSTGVVVEYADATQTDGRIVTAYPARKEGKSDAERVYERDKNS